MAFPHPCRFILAMRLQRQVWRSKPQNLADARHHDLCRMALHRSDKTTCIWSEDIKSSIVTWNGGVEMKIPFDRESCGFRAHREAVADRHEANLWCIDFRDQSHV